MSQPSAARDEPAKSSDDGRGILQLGYRAPLDGLRGIAVLLVVIAHSADLMWSDASSWMLVGGHLGVHLFFVLSGFLITTVLITEVRRTGGISLANFARRRARRLLPGVVALHVSILVVAVQGTRIEIGDAAGSALHGITFTTNYNMTHGEVPLIGWLAGDTQLVPDMLHTWSLSVEVHFYVLWAFAMWLFLRARWSIRSLGAALAATTVVIALVRAQAYSADEAWGSYYFDTWPRLDAPFIGALAALVAVGGMATKIPARGLAWGGGAGLALFLLAAGTVEGGSPALPYGLYTALAVCAAATILAVVQLPRSRLASWLSWPPLVWFGMISYSLYLWHYRVFMSAARRDWPVGIRWGLGLAVAIGVGWVSYRLIERPFLRPKRETAAGTPDIEAQPAVSGNARNMAENQEL